MLTSHCLRLENRNLPAHKFVTVAARQYFFEKFFVAKKLSEYTVQLYTELENVILTNLRSPYKI